MEADFEDATARLHLSNLSIADYGTIVNGLFHGSPPSPGKVSFDLRWSGELKRGSFSDSTKPFEMDFVQTGAHISWSGQTGADNFHSTEGAQTVSFAQIARERNGAFFHRDSEDD